MGRALAAACLMALVSCTGAEGPPRGRAVTLQAFGDPAELDAYESLFEAFRRRSGIEVEFVSVPSQDDHYAKLAASFASGAPPDVFLANFRRFPQFAAGDVIQAPGSRLTGELAPSKFFGPPVEAFTWSGEQLCVPQNVSSLVVYYNRDVFTGAGVSVPRRGWGFGEFFNAAVRLTTPDRHGLAMEPRLIRLAPIVWSAGGEIASDEGFTLDTEAGRLALQVFMEMGRSVATPTEEELAAENAETRFMSGRAAMVLGSRRLVTTFRTITDFTWDVADFPQLDQPASILHSDAYCVSKASGRQRDAFELVSFAASAEGQRILARTGRIVPSRRDVARSDAFLAGDAPATPEVFLDAIEHLRRTPKLSTWPDIERAADVVLEEPFFEEEAPGGPVVDEVTPVLKLLDRRTKRLFRQAEAG